MGAAKLRRGQQREIALDGLTRGNVSGVARDHGVSRRTVYDLMEDATEDPEGAIQEARAELEYRQRVREIVGSGAAPAKSGSASV